MATPTPYDQASRYLVKMYPHETLAWMMDVPQKNFAFKGWIDPKLPEELGYPDRQSDTVAEIERKDTVGPLWASILEYQSSIVSDMHYRVTDYSNKVEWHSKPTKNKGDRYSVGSIVLNLTGIQKPHRRTQWKKAGFLRDHRYRIINVETLSATSILKKVESKELPINLLGFVPLMKGGTKPAIIKRWIAQAKAVESNTVRSDLGSIAKLFSELVGDPEEWTKALEGWNMVESKFINEIRAEEAVSNAQEFIVEIMVRRFGVSPAHESTVSQIENLERLRRMRSALIDVTSWDALLEIR